MADREVGHRSFMIFCVKKKENVFVLHPSFRIFAIKTAKLLRLDKKKKLVSLFCARLFVTLQAKKNN
jgi:hypothetical protein